MKEKNRQQIEEEVREQPPYTWLRKFSLYEAVISRELRMALYYFIMFQISVLFLTLSTATDYRKSMIILTMTIAVGISIQGLREVERRQNKKSNVREVTLGRVLTLLMSLYAIMMVVSLLLTKIGVNIPTQQNQELLKKVMEDNFYTMGFIAVFVAPIVEELVFREYIPHVLGLSKVSFLVSSVIFTLMHSPTEIVGFVIYMTLSLVFLYVRLKDNNIKTVVYLHMVYNFMALVIGTLA